MRGVSKDPQRPWPSFNDSPTSGWLLRMRAMSRGRQSAYAAAFFFSSRSSRRRILPTLVFGRSVLNSICFGTL